jgi:hypothetical protein
MSSNEDVYKRYHAIGVEAGVSPKQKEATDHNSPPPAGNYVLQPRCV